RYNLARAVTWPFVRRAVVEHAQVVDLSAIGEPQRGQPRRVGQFVERADLVFFAPNPSPAFALLPFLHLRLLTVRQKAYGHSDNQGACNQQKLSFHNRVSCGKSVRSPAFRRKRLASGNDLHPTLPPKGGTTNCATYLLAGALQGS